MSAAHADRLAAARADVERAQRDHADAVAAADAVRPDAASPPLPACILPPGRLTHGVLPHWYTVTR